MLYLPFLPSTPGKKKPYLYLQQSLVKGGYVYMDLSVCIHY